MRAIFAPIPIEDCVMIVSLTIAWVMVIVGDETTEREAKWARRPVFACSESPADDRRVTSLEIDADGLLTFHGMREFSHTTNLNFYTIALPKSCG